ncbi:MAG: CsgG/HfaB family protein [Candidatus Bipolaricaulia bacterium]
MRGINRSFYAFSLLVLVLVVVIGCAPIPTSTQPSASVRPEIPIQTRIIAFAPIRIAVSEFEDRSGTIFRWAVGRGMSDMLTTALFETGKFEPIERQALEQVIAEQRLGLSGLVNPATAAEVGRILGVEQIIVGAVTEFGIQETGIDLPGVGAIRQDTARVVIDVRIVDTTTAKILAAATAEGSEFSRGIAINVNRWQRFRFGDTGFDDTIIGKATRQAIDELVVKISDAIPSKGLVATVQGDIVILNFGRRSDAAPGMILNVYRTGEPIRDPVTGEVLTLLETKLGEVQVIEVQENVTLARKLGAFEVEVGDIVRPKI